MLHREARSKNFPVFPLFGDLKTNRRFSLFSSSKSFNISPVSFFVANFIPYAAKQVKEYIPFQANSIYENNIKTK